MSEIVKLVLGFIGFILWLAVLVPCYFMLDQWLAKVFPWTVP